MPFWDKIVPFKSKNSPRQVAKCVTECKSQASGAKKVMSGLARSRKKRAQVAAGSAGEPDDFDSGDDWSSSEFDTDDEDEDKDYSTTINTEDGFSASDFASDNVSTNGPESVASSDSSGQYNDVALELRPTMPGRTGNWNVKGPSNGRELDTSTPEPTVVLKSVIPLQAEGTLVVPVVAPKPARSPIPKPPAEPPQQLGQLSPIICNNNSNSPTSASNVVQRRSVPRLQRPPSQPPAPPLAKNRSEPDTPSSIGDDECWEYEIPNSGIPLQQSSAAAAPPPPVLGQQQQTLVKVLPAAPQFRLPPLHHQEHLANGTSAQWNHVKPGDLSPNDTYEPVDKPEEETYEAVDESLQSGPDQLPVGREGIARPCLPPRKPTSLPPHLLLVPPLPEKPSKMLSQPLPPAPPPAPESIPALPSSKGLSSSKSMSQLVNKFRSKLGGRRESNVSAKDIEVAIQQDNPFVAPPTSNSNGPVTVNGSPVSFHPVPVPPSLGSQLSSPVLRASPTQQPSQVSVPGNEDTCSMTLRPLPPVPSSQDKGASLSEDRLETLPYYVDIEREEAEQRLLALREDDAYLVRPSRRGGLDNPHTLTLIHKGRPFHLNIRLRPDGRYALGRKKDNEMVFASVSALITHHQRHPIYLSAHGENVGTSLLKRHL